MAPPHAPAERPPRHRPRVLARSTALALAAVVTLALVAVWTVRSVAGTLRDRTAARTTVTHDLVVERVRDVAKLVTTEATVRDVVVYESTWLGSTKRSLVVATGRVLAGIDLGADGAAAAVRIDHAARRIAVELPPAEVLGVDVVGLRTYDERAGLWNLFRPADRDSIQLQVRAHLERAGRETGLLEQANRSAVRLLQALLAQDGYTVDVSVRARPVVTRPPG